MGTLKAPLRHPLPAPGSEATSAVQPIPTGPLEWSGRKIAAELEVFRPSPGRTQYSPLLTRAASAMLKLLPGRSTPVLLITTQAFADINPPIQESGGERGALQSPIASATLNSNGRAPVAMRPTFSNARGRERAGHTVRPFRLRQAPGLRAQAESLREQGVRRAGFVVAANGSEVACGERVLNAEFDVRRDAPEVAETNQLLAG
jgi:hypothetical protein